MTNLLTPGKMEDCSASQGSAGASRHEFRCSICGRFLDPGSPSTASGFTPDTHFTYERTEWFHASCEARTGKRSSFKMDFAP
jgi:rubredoxin